MGRTALIANDPRYPHVYGFGFGELAGRIGDLTYDAAHRRLIAAVANGGVWESLDLGGHWRSIGDRLPTQVVGSVTYTPARGGTIVALTGDSATVFFAHAGVGAYWSADGGRHWRRARGIPYGTLGFKVAVDPVQPAVLYAATGVGLYRSTDAGRSFVNVDLPTGRCHGNSFQPDCFLANVVTDVVVQRSDRFGHRGGAVLAAVGWPSGSGLNFNYKPQAPANDLYLSANGAPGTFERLHSGQHGFAPQDRIGRVELGAATGRDQNSDYVYALVQDAKLFGGLDVIPGTITLKSPTLLNGIYVSSTFGRTWRRMASGDELQLPTNGSTLAQVALALSPAIRLGPGYQADYNQWIAPDPTRHIRGVPTRVVFGLEEVFQNSRPGPQDGRTEFKAIGPYFASGAICLLENIVNVCSTKQSLLPPALTTTHPDHHAGIFIPDGRGGVTLVDGNDGGVSVQHAAAGREFQPTRWGRGAQGGFHTLLPYGVAVARDGTVWAGLQDNGGIRIDPKTGRQNETLGGDGLFAQVDPDNPDVAYVGTPAGIVSVTRDGGRHWSVISPGVSKPFPISPLVMDPQDPRHLLTGGREVAETTFGPDTQGASLDADVPLPLKTWRLVFDTGTTSKPGKPPAGTPGDVENQVVAADLQGDAAYVAFCGSCDPAGDFNYFSAGIATNVGGSRPPKRLTKRGWHLVPAHGLPRRRVNSLQIDPHDSKTIYATLGAGAANRPSLPVAALGDTHEEGRGGYVYKSSDGGRTFHDVTGNLPRISATWTAIHRGHLVVATSVGVFESLQPISAAPRRRPRYAPLGRGLPNVPVFSMAIAPGGRGDLYAATFGRGIYRYPFTPVSCCD